LTIFVIFCLALEIGLGLSNPNEKRKFMREKSVMNRFLEGSRGVKTLVTLLVVLGLWSCSRKMDSINFGAIPSGSAAFIYIAQDQRFFTANGLSVNVKNYATGVATVDASLKGDVDIAWAAEFPLVRKVFTKEKISIIAVLSRFSDQYLFCRQDHGVKSISDLKGKKIGLPRNTIVEFYFARFLELNGMNIKDVSLVDVPPPKSVNAMTGGSIDGVVTWEPYSGQIKAQLADQGVAWPVQSSQPGYGVIIGRNDWIRGNLEIVKRFLKSLAQAEDFLIHNPKAAKAAVQSRVNYDDTSMEIFWSESQFALSLDQSLISAMEDEARWMIKNNLTPEKQVPDFLSSIYIDGLKAVKPEAVNIIR
jgi:NitT/TauT family transport system substrate-binding protein